MAEWCLPPHRCRHNLPRNEFQGMLPDQWNPCNFWFSAPASPAEMPQPLQDGAHFYTPKAPYAACGSDIPARPCRNCRHEALRHGHLRNNKSASRPLSCHASPHGHTTPTQIRRTCSHSHGLPQNNPPDHPARSPLHDSTHKESTAFLAHFQDKMWFLPWKGTFCCTNPGWKSHTVCSGSGTAHSHSVSAWSCQIPLSTAAPSQNYTHMRSHFPLTRWRRWHDFYPCAHSFGHGLLSLAPTAGCPLLTHSSGETCSHHCYLHSKFQTGHVLPHRLHQ